MDGKARAWHLLTGVVATFAVVLQLVLVWRGHAVLDETNPPSLGTRLERFFCYFTVLSNILVALTTLTLAVGADRDSKVWRVLRLDGLVGIAVTGVVHWFFLRPLLDLHGSDYFADKLLHVVVPLLAVVGWLVFGPRDRVERGDLAPSTIYPLVYMVWTLLHGAISDWYPYPFTDVNEHGIGLVLLNGVGVVALFAGIAVGALWLDRRLPGVRATTSVAEGQS
jgi:hypothetical protein